MASERREGATHCSCQNQSKSHPNSNPTTFRRLSFSSPIYPSCFVLFALPEAMASASSSSSSVAKNAPKEDQLWFFLLEDMPVPSFAQHTRTLSEVRNMDITLRECLKITKAKGDVNDYAFYIHSQGMSAAVQLLTDESIIATYNLYCRADGLVLIIIRGKDDPSPNISRSSNYAQSLADRRKQSAARGIAVPELPIQPKVRHKTGSADITTIEPITEHDDIVSI